LPYMVGFCWNYNDCPSQQGMSLKVLQKQLKGCGECLILDTSTK
jgi:hypothetical protein